MPLRTNFGGVGLLLLAELCHMLAPWQTESARSGSFLTPLISRPSFIGWPLRRSLPRVQRADKPLLLQIRPAQSSDASALLKFSCKNPNQKWTGSVEASIRSEVAAAVADSDPEVIVFVAEVDDALVGVVAAVRTEGDNNFSIPALAVTHEWRHRGIGTALKQEVLGLCTDGQIVVSEVHRRNTAMIALNTKLNASAATDPADGNYLLTVTLPPEPL